MQRSQDRLTLLAQRREAFPRDYDLLRAVRPGALAKQRQRFLPRARLNLGQAIIDLAQNLRGESAL